MIHLTIQLPLVFTNILNRQGKIITSTQEILPLAALPLHIVVLYAMASPPLLKKCISNWNTVSKALQLDLLILTCHELKSKLTKYLRELKTITTHFYVYYLFNPIFTYSSMFVMQY